MAHCKTHPADTYGSSMYSTAMVSPSMASMMISRARGAPTESQFNRRSGVGRGRWMGGSGSVEGR